MSFMAFRHLKIYNYTKKGLRGEGREQDVKSITRRPSCGLSAKVKQHAVAVKGCWYDKISSVPRRVIVALAKAKTESKQGFKVVLRSADLKRVRMGNNRVCRRVDESIWNSFKREFQLSLACILMKIRKARFRLYYTDKV